ncbi:MULTISPECIES: neuraminidase-like domain-containing protein [Mycetohabitans]|uniref:Tc toxin subunit A-related protein n=1 Tax=Mycetohabitans TaxID=2571159 RepID=UPI001EEB9382|nr:neuraminidase-like domain-containing protein [Mycetohabitans sp. B3]MCF2134309.1 hypothetical protein [Mycetohabitans sp. B3]
MDYQNKMVNLLSKLNKAMPILSLPEIAQYSFEEFSRRTCDVMNWGEKRQLYNAAIQQKKEVEAYERKILTHANPQLRQALSLSMPDMSQDIRSYDDMFGYRASKYVAEGAVSSMFSPAAYLTELYREAVNFHDVDSSYHLDKRRPDLGSLNLNQNNMDEEVTTLSLSNEILLNGILEKDAIDTDAAYLKLASYRYTGETPYHHAHHSICQTLTVRDVNFQDIMAVPALVPSIDQTTLLGVDGKISPELYDILVEDIDIENIEELFKKNFKFEAKEYLFNAKALAQYYNVDANIIEELIGTPGEYDPYSNENVFTAAEGNGKIFRTNIVGKNGGFSVYNYVNIEFLEGKWGVNVNVNRNYEEIVNPGYCIVQYDNQSIGRIEDYQSNLGVNYFIEIGENISPDVEIVVEMWDETGGGFITARYTFAVLEASHEEFLLAINKLVRLHKATELPLAIIERVARLGSRVQITNDVLRDLLLVKRYQKRYAIDVDEALILAGADIATTSERPLSQFDMLFNTPLLNGQRFDWGGDKLQMKPDAQGDDHRRAVLKRAFDVDNIGLYLLGAMPVFPFLEEGRRSADAIENSLTNLSSLYRVKLLADVHGLSVQELNLLLTILGCQDLLLGVKDGPLSELIEKVYRTTQWMDKRGWNVASIYLMTTIFYDTTQTPEIENLVRTLCAGLTEETSATGDDLKIAMAPYIASSLGLSSADVARYLLIWADKINALAFKVDDFWGAVKDLNIDALKVPPKAVQFCHHLAQLALINTQLQWSEAELAMAVNSPRHIKSDLFFIHHDVASLMLLTRYHDWVSSLGESASQVLAALSQNTLTVSSLASAMGIDEATLQLAADQLEGQPRNLTDFLTIDALLQWHRAAVTLGVAPNDIAQLLALRYGTEHDYARWQAVAGTLIAGLTSLQGRQVSVWLDERLSTALSFYYINTVAAPELGITDRDGLYQYLLIDNQVRADVKTSRIAEAIASVQLYVNRCLQRLEDNVNSIVSGRSFFKEWDRYNKRYSTWAGVSLLTYYPENYLDPTQRIGQTAMLSNLLQIINQSQLNADTTEAAFKSYLTNFEQIANLTIVSGYHDHVNINQGITYFVGVSQSEPREYYWRSVDHDKFDGAIVPANAWSEWLHINCAINPFENLIRPIILESRLYTLWVERREVVEQKNGAQDKAWAYEIKLSYHQYDGTWSSPLSYEIDTALLSGAIASKNIGLYCSAQNEEHTLLTILYEKKDNYAIDVSSITGLAATTNAIGWLINDDLSGEDISSSDLNNILKVVSSELDTKKTKKIGNRYMPRGYSTSSSVDKSRERKAGELSLSKIQGGRLTSISILDDGTLSFKAQIKLCYEGMYSDLMRFCGDGMDKFLHFSKKSDNNLKAITHASGKDGEVIGISYHTWINNPYILITPFSRGVAIDEFQTNWKSNSFSEKFQPKSSRESYKKIDVVKRSDGIHGAKYLDINDIKEIDLALASATVEILGKKFSYKDKFPAPSMEDMAFDIDVSQVKIPKFEDDEYFKEIPVVLAAMAKDGRFLGSETFIITVSRRANDAGNVMSINKIDNGVQYMQIGWRRIRLNTLFAKKLISLANKGIDNVLSLSAQEIQEPQLGEGSYFDFFLPPYDKSAHGENRYFEVRLWIPNDIGEAEQIEPYPEYPIERMITCHRGALSENTLTRFRLFIPTMPQSDGIIAFASVYFESTVTPNLAIIIIGIENGDFLKISSVQVNQEPMDFSGANALYFWELFYYSPMMVMQRLLQEQNFDEANRWLSYVFSPAGYPVDGQYESRQWNVRPLLESTSWNLVPLDSTDPDAVAQADPMHYKVATFMRLLDLLIERGDHAYRQLERDTLAEAKMWYVQALNLLGEEPNLDRHPSWSAPTLRNAASQTTAAQYWLTLERLQPAPIVADGEPLTANSLISLFLPQENVKLKSYWQTLAQRLYNLRHNLTLDGQPLSLPLYASPADPSTLLSAAVASSQGGTASPTVTIGLRRFPHMLESARGLVSQLMQFGGTLSGIIERQDAEALAALMHTQAAELMTFSIQLQDRALDELAAERTVLERSLVGAQSRFAHYNTLYDEDVSIGERQAMDLRLSSSTIALGTKALHMTAAGLEMVPNIYGLATGGARYGALANAIANGSELASSAIAIAAERVSQSEAYRRRRQEWEVLRNSAETEVNQIEAQLQVLAIRQEAAQMQKVYLETQQAQTHTQLTFLQRKFSNVALYNWLRGRLSALYFQLYAQTASRCLLAEQSYQWETQTDDRFIRPGAWHGTYAGLLSGESLMLNLTELESAYLKWESRALEVQRTVSLADVYRDLEADFDLAETIAELIAKGKGDVGEANKNGLKLDENGILSASVNISGLKLKGDYPDDLQLGRVRRIKQISVTLPALLGPYQDVQATLSYTGSLAPKLPKGCTAIAVSHGMNDSGQFQLDFNDGQYLPFEGIPIEDDGTFVLRFPNATGKQKALLQSLSDVILHIRYTICS